jgi:hypothetical protein
MRLALTMSADFGDTLKFEAEILGISLLAHVLNLIQRGFSVLREDWPTYSLHELEATGFLRSPSAKLYRVVATKGGNTLDDAAAIVDLHKAGSVACPQGRLDTALVVRRALYLGWLRG